MTISSSPEDAISAAIGIARHHGIRVAKPVALRSTNHVVAWLCPAPIVAKVAIRRNARLDTELKVARELAVLDAPVVQPAPEMPPIVHSRYGFEVTFWRYHAQSPSVEIPAACIAPTLRRLHAALAQISATLRASLPSYMHELNSVRSLLTDSDGLPALPGHDRDLLAATFDRLRAEMNALVRDGDNRVLHGSPHLYNVLVVDGKPAFIDLETACIGPVEWDLAHLDEAGEPAYGEPVNSRLLWLCRAMASVKTATWCWADIERGDLREHAEWHLSRVRTGVAPRVLGADERSFRDPARTLGSG